MPEILSINPVPGNKSAILHNLSDGSRVYHCRTHMNPVAYGPMDKLKWIELNSLLDTSSKSVNGIWLRDKNIMSLGVRKDGQKNKYLGIRPDDNQTGSEQFEITIERIQYDGIDIPVDVAKHIQVDAVTADLGNVIIRATRQGARQMVKVPSQIKHFKIIFTVHHKGLDYKKMADLDEEWFYSKKTGQFRLRLRKPLLIDADTYEPLEGVQHLITHTVINNHDGTLTYIKESTKDFSAGLLPQSYLIDLDPIYSDTTDGYVQYVYGAWAGCHNATTGSSSNTSSSYLNNAMMTKHPFSYEISRSFFYYNTSGITGIITEASNYLYGYTNANSSVSAQKGTQADALTTADYDSFTGNEYGHVSWGINQYKQIAFNAQGLADIVKDGTSKICCREYEHDYLYATPDSSTYNNGCYFSDNTGTTKDPYLSLTVQPLISITDTGAGSDALTQLKALLSVIDTGTGSDALTQLKALLSIVDTGSGADVAQIKALLSVIDIGEGADGIPVINVSLAVSDIGAGSDIINFVGALISLIDTGEGSDSVPAINVSLTVPDSGMGVDVLSFIGTLISLADSGTGIDVVVNYRQDSKRVDITFTPRKPSINITPRKGTITFTKI